MLYMTAPMTSELASDAEPTSDAEPKLCGRFPRLDFLLCFCQHFHPYRSLAFTRHCQKLKAITTMAQSLLPDRPGRTLIGWGDRGKASGSPGIGSLGSPSERVRKVLARLPHRCSVVEIDEFRTSKVGLSPVETYLAIQLVSSVTFHQSQQGHLAHGIAFEG